MAGPVLNLGIFKKSKNHTLRAISLAIFPPGFILLFIQGIGSGDVNPAIGIIPFFFSAAYSALLLANEKKCGCQASGLTGTPVHLVFDVLLAAALIVCLILNRGNFINNFIEPAGLTENEEDEYEAWKRSEPIAGEGVDPIKYW
ncbi:hypothetical protein PtrEW4_011846, partial [Pyrenophora tritici-repentis]